MCGVLQELDLYDEAIEAGETGVRLSPDNIFGVYNLARAFGKLELWEKEVQHYERCIELDPLFYKARLNKALTLVKLHRYDQAEQASREAIELSPEDVKAVDCLAFQGKYDEAISCFYDAIKLEPDRADTHNNLSHVLLTKEYFSTGWKEYEYGLRTKARGPIEESDIPEWQGESLNGRLIYLVGEQGVGDQILFSSMIPELISQNATVIFECDERLIPLYKNTIPELIATPLGNRQPVSELLNSDRKVDYRIPIGSLCKFLRQSVDSFTPSKRFLEPDPALTERYKKNYQKLGKGPVIGISWKSHTPGFFLNKSVEIDQWKSILTLPDVVFVSLQYGDVDEDIARVKKEFGVDIYVDPNVSALNSIEQCAAQVSAVDLVISTSNATVHVAGGCGVEAWVMLAHVPLWHWFLERDKSLWYESLQLFRQGPEGSWQDIINLVADKLKTKFI
jgi:hypothetical protein